MNSCMTLRIGDLGGDLVLTTWSGSSPLQVPSPTTGLSMFCVWFNRKLCLCLRICYDMFTCVCILVQDHPRSRLSLRRESLNPTHPKFCQGHTARRCCCRCINCWCSWSVWTSEKADDVPTRSEFIIVFHGFPGVNLQQSVGLPRFSMVKTELKLWPGSQTFFKAKFGIARW